MPTELGTTRGKNASASTPFDEQDWERVGETLRSLRETRGFKPDEFASQIGISRPYLANIEAGRKKLTNVLLAKAAQALRVEQLAIMRPRTDSTTTAA